MYSQKFESSNWKSFMKNVGAQSDSIKVEDNVKFGQFHPSLNGK